MSSPLALPENYDVQAHMPAHQVHGRVFHATIPSVQLASELMANGTPADIAEAADIFRAVLTCQEVREADPHLGNFRWELEDEVVEDLNAVQFVLFYCIPVLCKTPDALPPDLLAAMRRAIALGLQEIARIDVAPIYTNIVIKDIVNSCLGGQLLNDEATARRGREKLVRWIAHVDTYGLPAEYNSPNYASVAVRVLGRLVELTEDEHTRIRARTMLARLGLSAALHIHPGIGNWAGPFSRAYSHAVFNADAFNIDSVRAWLDDGQLPAWIGDLLQRPDVPQQIDETAHGEEPVALSTYHSPSFSLGVASCELKTQEVIFIALQSCVFHAQYLRPDDAPCGVLFSRYILDDQWLNFQTTPSREPGQVVPEEGHFYGVHERGRAIGLYAPHGLDAWMRRTSAKAVLVWTEVEQVDEIWIGPHKVDALPAEVPQGEVVVVGSGGLWTAVLPLELTDLGGGAPIRLVELGGHLALEMYNYTGPAKTFWEMAKPGSFYKGQPRCGFYCELSERADYASGADFAAKVASGTLLDEAAPAATYTAGDERALRVEYARDDRVLGIEVDLYEWSLTRRWTQDGPLSWPMHESPYARQSASGEVSVGGATLTCDKGPIWLCACPGGKRYIAAYSGPEIASLRLEVPGDVVELAAIGAGIVVWDEGEVTVEAILS
ncbi:MAG: hypothetical protein VX893_14810 [Candidatus Latescibacterota bacterium]|nr:hypothetical protein [Candidatus Latescibacterota bacterium]